MATIQYSADANLCGGPKPSSTPQPTPTPVTVSVELHVCMGLNACKGHDRIGTNNCAGTGLCATAEQHNCQTLNNCRGQGGCGLYGDIEAQSNPGNNECAWQGSCAVPIQAERFRTLGPERGKSVWLQARKVFEERMKKAKRNVGPAPFECGPPQAWLIKSLVNYDSCGNSGDKTCSFGFNKPEDNAERLCEGKRE